jgi:hypothetical protein
MFVNFCLFVFFVCCCGVFCVCGLWGGWEVVGSSRVGRWLEAVGLGGGWKQ